MIYILFLLAIFLTFILYCSLKIGSEYDRIIEKERCQAKCKHEEELLSKDA